jgi:hypothetical protein
MKNVALESFALHRNTHSLSDNLRGIFLSPVGVTVSRFCEDALASLFFRVSFLLSLGGVGGSFSPTLWPKARSSPVFPGFHETLKKRDCFGNENTTSQQKYHLGVTPPSPVIPNHEVVRNLAF